MGLIGKVIGAAVVTVAAGAAVAADLLKSKDKKLLELDLEFKEYEHRYELERERLLEKIGRGDRRAEKRLRELDHRYELHRIEYESERKKLLPQKSSRANIDVSEHSNRDKILADSAGEHEIHIDTHEEVKDATEEEIKNVTCPLCNKSISQEAKFCSYCGYEIKTEAVTYCSHCGARLEPDSMFCSMCGHTV